MHLRQRLLGNSAVFNAADPPAGGAPAVVATPPAAPVVGDPGTQPAPTVPPVPVAATEPPGTKPGETPVSVAAVKPDWKDARIAELTAKLNAAKRAPVEVPAPSPAPSRAPAPTEAEISARVQVEAARLSQIKTWNEACEAVAAAGNKKFADFGEKLKAVQSAVNGEDALEVAQYTDVLTAAIETGKAPELLHQLGANPGEVTRLMRLPPVKRAVEIAMMAAKLEGGVPEPSSAPKPVTPIGSHGQHFDGIKPDDPVQGTKLPIGEWMKQREKQAEERRIQ